jgi:NADPH:quinone reductase
MPHAVRVHKTGGPDVLTYEAVDPGKPAKGEVLIAQTAIGLNFIDTYHRSGLYPVPALPSGIGMEAAGTVQETGPDVKDIQVGDRVAYANPPPGAYATHRVMPTERLVPLPEDISDQQAAGILLKGMTAEYLIRRTYPVKKGETVLLHAAAGGVGLIATSWLRGLGATVIGTVGSDEKAKLAKEHGCHHVIRYDQEDFTERVKEITDGRGVDVVYDGVGKATWEGSLDSLRPRGMMVSFGNASGEVPPFKPIELSHKGSLYLTRPKLFDYTATRADLLDMAHALFAALQSGLIQSHITTTYPLREAERAHRDLEARHLSGSTLLIPEE